jgi:hypothetical protein
MIPSLTAICCNLHPIFYTLTIFIYTHMHTHTHTHIIYIGGVFCCKLQQIAVSLTTIATQTIFGLYNLVAP